MLTTTQHLNVRRPSPTTVEFIVSTSPSPTLFLRILLFVTTILRVLVSLNILLLLYCKYQISFGITVTLQEPYYLESDLLDSSSIWHLMYWLTTSRLGQLCTSFASRISLSVLLPSSSLALHLLSLRFHTSESLLVLRSLGLQTSSSSKIFGVSDTTRFIPMEKIQDILINEAFRGFEVRYYLVVVVENEEELLVVFPRLSPRREIVEKVWRDARACLWEGVDEGLKRNGKEEGEILF